MIVYRSAARALLLGCSLLAAASSRAAELSAQAWKEDLDFLARELPARHKNLFYKLPRKDFEDQVARLSDALPGMADVDVRAALTRLVASARNAHTAISAFSDSAQYPILFRCFEKDYYVVAAMPEVGRAIGARLVGIGEMDWAEVMKRMLPLIPQETDGVVTMELPGLLHNADALRGAGILPGTDRATFRLEKDRRSFTIAIASVPKIQQAALANRPQGAAYDTPMYFSDRRTNYWFRYLPDTRALYIQYNACEEMKSLSFADFTAQVMEAADANLVDKVILDLRHNGGGNSEVINPLIQAIKARPALRRPGHLFVLTSPYTFSSGFLNAWEFRTMFKAVIAGEPSAQRPTSYGDIRTFELPNSKLKVWYCVKFFRFMRGDPPAMLPDLPVVLTAQDYFSGRDPVLDRILGPNYRTPPASR